MLIKSKRVWLDGSFKPCTIEINKGIITNLFDYQNKADIDYGDKRIIPGIIDVHSHGGYDFDTNDGTIEGLKTWAKNITKEGVTSFLPTTVTSSKDTLCKALNNVAQVIDSNYEGASILGIHLEGPFINKKYKGSQPEQYIVEPDIELFEEFQKAANGHIVYVTLAPEKDKDFKLIDYLKAHNVVASLGHCCPTYEEVLKAHSHGASSITHVYNGMPLFNHRDNGLVGAAFSIEDMYGEIIADLKHSTPVALKMLAKAKGEDYLIMVSDSLLVKGLLAGTKRLFGGQEITVDENGLALLNDGTIAGSTLKANIGLKNMIEVARIDLKTAINSATINPARCLGVNYTKGSIEINKDGDLVVLDDDYSVIQTYVKGVKQL